MPLQKVASLWIVVEEVARRTPAIVMIDMAEAEAAGMETVVEVEAADTEIEVEGAVVDMETAAEVEAANTEIEVEGAVVDMGTAAEVEAADMEAETEAVGVGLGERMTATMVVVLVPGVGEALSGASGTREQGNADRAFTSDSRMRKGRRIGFDDLPILVPRNDANLAFLLFRIVLPGFFYSLYHTFDSVSQMHGWAGRDVANIQ